METDKTPAVGNLGPASTSAMQGTSPASSSEGSNSNNHEPWTSSSIQSGVLFNYNKKSLTTPSRPVSSFVKDSSVSAFQVFHHKVFEKLRDGIPLITVLVATAVFGTDMEVHLVMNDVQAMCYMEDLSVNCVMAYIRHLYDVLVKREMGHKFEFINPASVSSAKDGDLSKIITSSWEWVLIPLNREGSWALAVLHMEAMKCYWLDTSESPPQPNIRESVVVGLQRLA